MIKRKPLSEECKRKIGLANKGKFRPPELRKRLSDALKGRPLSEETKQKMKGRIPWNKGKKGLYKMSLETRLKMSKSRPRGENHPNWKGGVSTENERIRKSLEYILWRQAVFARDNYTCQICGIAGGWNKKQKRTIILQADHIKPFALYPELRFAIDNGRTLCKDCHRQTDTWGGTTKYKIGHPDYRKYNKQPND